MIAHIKAFLSTLAIILIFVLGGIATYLTKGAFLGIASIIFVIVVIYMCFLEKFRG